MNTLEQLAVEELAHWINERERVRIAKEAGKPKPWSKDPVFQYTYFCNVHREDDKTTKWIANNWRDLWPHPNYEVAIVLSRFINRIETLEELGFPFQWDKEKYLQKFRDIRGTKWGSAYVITTHGQKMDKDTYVFDAVDWMADDIQEVRQCTTCRAAWEFLRQYDGMGSFLSAQVVADFKNTEEHPLADAVDFHSFSAPGPGSLRGLSWFWGEQITERTYYERIEEAYKITMPHLGDHVGKIHMQDFQNCLCEFDKYMRVKLGTGRSKRRYPGAA